MTVPAEALPLEPGHYVGAEDITPADGVTFAPARAIYVGTGGALVCQTPEGNAAIALSVPNGTLLKIRVNGVAATGTTASNIIALY